MPVNVELPAGTLNGRLLPAESLRLQPVTPIDWNSAIALEVDEAMLWYAEVEDGRSAATTYSTVGWTFFALGAALAVPGQVFSFIGGPWLGAGAIGVPATSMFLVWGAVAGAGATLTRSTAAAHGASSDMSGLEIAGWSTCGLGAGMATLSAGFAFSTDGVGPGLLQAGSVLLFITAQVCFHVATSDAQKHLDALVTVDEASSSTAPTFAPWVGADDHGGVAGLAGSF